MNPLAGAIDSERYIDRLVGRMRLVFVPVILLAAVATTLGQVQTVKAEAPVGNCQEVRAFKGFGDEHRWPVAPYGNQCFGLYLRAGYTYTIDVEASPYLPCNPQRPCRNLEDSTVELFAHQQTGVWSGQPSLGQSSYTSVAFNDDVAYPTNLSSHIVHTPSGTFGAYTYHIIKVAGYQASEGWFEMKVFEALQMAEPCRTYWC